MLSKTFSRFSTFNVASSKDYVVKKVTDINNWYKNVIGLHEVYQCQERVITVQKCLLEAQDKRRIVGKQLAELRSKSLHLQEQLHKINRQVDLQRFLDLMKEETEVLKEEQILAREFTFLDNEERERFTEFTNAIQVSHETQRTQTEYSKYLSFTFSILGAFLAFMYSAFRQTIKPEIIELQKSHKELKNQIIQFYNKNELNYNNHLSNCGKIQHQNVLSIPPASNENIEITPQQILKYGLISFVSLLILRSLF